MNTQRIAVIGSGIAGLASAWLLAQRHTVTLFEKNDYFGGHTHTVEVDTPDGPLGVDTGFIVYNQRNYPLLTSLYDWLGVKTQATDMSFGVSINRGELEYAGSDLNGLFAQRTNLLKPGFLRMVSDILRFNREARNALNAVAPAEITLGEFLQHRGFSRALTDHYLLPMAAAIWSCPTETMLGFPLHSFLRFFHNHGLIQLNNRPEWRTVCGGSQRYVDKLLADLPATTRRHAPVTGVATLAHGVRVRLRDGSTEMFDSVVLASHADQTLALLENPDPRITRVLQHFRYQPNRAILHRDASLMPANRRAWSSWNYLSEPGTDGRSAVAVTYWMNRLQNLPTDQPYFVTLNPPREPRADTVVKEMNYDHPVFDSAAVSAQSALPTIQGAGNLWFAGSYHGYGFHEDALRSGVELARRFGIVPPWQGRSPFTLARAA